MKNPKKLAIIFCTLAALAFLTNCNRNPAKDGFADGLDGSAAFMATELSDMNSAAFPSSNSALHKSAFMNDSITIETNIVRRWEPSLNAIVRTATATNSKGGTRERTDTLYFYHNGALITDSSQLSFANIDSIVHIRHTVKTTINGVSIDLYGAMTTSIVKGADTLAVRNGTLVGTWDGTEKINGGWLAGRIFTGSRQVTNLTWERANGAWDHFPVSGTIDIDRPLKTIHIVFSSSETTRTATATVTRKRDGETKTIIIDLLTGEETEG
jgi:hypothetical protein